MKPTDEAGDARRRAVSWLGRREYSVAELETRLARAGYSADGVSATIDWLLQHDLLSDRRFAEALIRSRAAKGFGPLWIGSRLRAKGVAEADVQRAFDEAGHDWRQIARRACDKRFGATLCADLKEKSRRYRFLAQRGFAYDQIDYAIENHEEQC